MSSPTSRVPPGERAPDFTLPSTSGGEISLKSSIERGAVVLVFLRGRR
ncbi:MAG: hypothetical protein ACREOS_09785 [Candidatus Dormibacteraceae bacterium]